MIEPAWWWSWILMLTGVPTILLAGRKYWWAWLIGILSEICWVAYAWVTKQWGFVPFSLIYMAVYFKNAVTWRQEVPEE
jgi:hypothetical protein